jgi:hypothetical protein
VKQQKSRMGRPPKSSSGERRTDTIAFRVRGSLGDRLRNAAAKSGRTLSDEVEFWVERALAYDEMMKTMRTTLAEIERGNVEAAFVRLGYTPVHAPNGDKIWVPPSYELGRSGFVSEDEAQ